MNAELILKFAKQVGLSGQSETSVHPTMLQFAALIEEAERENCAQLCENLAIAHPGRSDLTAQQCANAIRARSVSDDSYLMLRREPAYKEGVWDQQVIK